MKNCDNVEDVEVNAQQKKIIWKFKDGSTLIDPAADPDLFTNNGLG